ncbi:InlB B-repeat-containing protein [Methanocorpusculum vombati]|uniref:InlB B-repeat-containing protein n=1 Tax=Methanocorpusculum vombati TaxID=3002864 RepID=A0ABT4INN3_9EURY|nr:InlB B-repeat-containing protein [Methanocorpusculum vombati]MCZ9320263.1 InlB B-repeat-containing protein [Methanocorpusculum sp.]MCZ0863366.1 InlB B-repeat-containing protein [Methanocorpusculum vombati]MDE2521312.1 InlB B-repeat-containing protein [Methanocorpusculum sp.]MDE2545171.1 InlB B-repeat-containing protein [Methanocorpusculum sp.]MDE2548624.1 InlB B-repeat-containing protein [Methanocorpusculum sp.]
MKVKCVRERASSALPVKSHLRRVMFTAAVLLLLVLFCTVPAAAGLEDAVEFAGGKYTLVQDLADDINKVTPNTVSVNGNNLELNKDINLTGELNISCEMTIVGNGHTIWRGVGNIDLIRVSDGGNLTLGDGKSTLIIDGNKANFPKGGCLIDIRENRAKENTVIMNNGVTLTNSTIEGGHGGAIHVNGNFTMNGGTITGNSVIGSVSGGGVMFIRGTFTMHGGEISDNFAGNFGGGVCIFGAAPGSFIMTGGKITNNTACQPGGGVSVLDGVKTFTMSGGEISGNIYSGNGPEVYHDGGKFTISGSAKISKGATYLSTGKNITLGGPMSSGGGIANITGAFGPGEVIVATESEDAAQAAFPHFKIGGAQATAYVLKVSGTNLIAGQYTVTYDGNGNTSGAVPVDSTNYVPNAKVTVKDNTGSLEKTNYVFDGWNTKADGKGTAYAPGANFNINEDTTLYAQWKALPVPLTGEKNVTVTWINSTIANVTIRLDPNLGDATDVYVKLGEKQSQKLNGKFPKGTTISDLQITGLTAGTTYSVTALLKNTDINTEEYSYEDILTGVQAPTPATVTITGEGGAELPQGGVSLPQGNSMTFGVIVKDNSGTILKDEPVTWSGMGSHTKEDTKTATTITLSGTSEGTDTLKAETVNGKASGTTEITVTTEKPTTLSIKADKTTIALGDTVQLTPEATGTYGQLFAGYDVTWKVSPTGTIGPSKTGASVAFKPENAGTYTINASIADPQLTATDITITVIGNPEISVQPESKEYVRTEAANDLSVTAAAPAGGSGTLAYQWQKSTDSSFKADISDVGTAQTYKPDTSSTGTTYYRVNVTYTEGSITTWAVSEVAKITVNEPTVDSISLEPNTLTISKGTSGTVTATGRNATVPNLALDADIAWSITEGQDNITIAPSQNKVTISGSAEGTAKVTASTGVDISAELSVTITNAPPTQPTSKPTQPPAPSGGSSGSGNMDNSFRVLFETSGGSFISPVTYLSYGDKISQPPAPTKDGYTFGGWYKDSACTQSWSFSEGIPGDITLYAKWTKTSGSNNGQQSKPTTQPTAKPTTAHETTKSPTVAATTAAPVTTTSAGGVTPTLTQAPAPVLGALLGLLAAGALLRRKD